MSEHPGFTAPATDPWRGLRGVMAGTLVLEVIVMVLTFPIVAKIGPGLTWVSGIYLGVVTLLMILACGMQGRRRALEIDIGLQILVIIGGVFHWSIAIVGLLFLFVWLYIRYVRADVARRMREGRLAGQEPIDS
ncbi:putative membrane protein [Gordonia polyisoprenivorans VH2]|uniref:DUF4233 domain-containing protein n=2 Tax=Gordonia polyisoprenivorans TaxID=84595 RepID=A0A846WP86_9ACTN|nr:MULTISPECIES: DUF4233 domain-containing protein [Gordonia]AFA72994.1 putative membrane protein [Gordonia polyisoprenivorans VH2]MBE7193007.1 DUF4233 domain-containing protein [Gordonia polyisoprenivorans]MDF3282168.1 DUF4233 domain-containing protein [Gordonia sp. N1V]NKY02600.1 DUF4233 domain-containing protein [Gordonia polyisoprenivorans]OPX15806.1 hypothetical protein B1964_08030 [Gordonia sp. i37]